MHNDSQASAGHLPQLPSPLSDVLGLAVAFCSDTRATVLGPSLLPTLMFAHQQRQQLLIRCRQDGFNPRADLLRPTDPDYRPLPLPGINDPTVDHNFALALPFWFIVDETRPIARAYGYIYPVRNTCHYLCFDDNGIFIRELLTQPAHMDQLPPIASHTQWRQWARLADDRFPIPYNAPTHTP